MNWSNTRYLLYRRLSDLLLIPCSTQDIRSKSQRIPPNPCCIMQWQSTKHQASPGREQSSGHHPATLQTMARLHPERCMHFWYLWFDSVGHFLFSCNIPLALHIATYFSSFYSTSQNSYCLTPALTGRKTNSACLLRFSRNQIFSSSCALLCHSSFLQKVQLQVSKED